jgi:hypothetical protein
VTFCRAACLFIALGSRAAAGSPLPITNGGSPSSDSAVVALAYSGDALECTGTVIAPHAVLTAAHCVGGTLPDVAIGDPLTTATRFDVIAAFVHPQFDPVTLDHDIAIVIVEPPLGPTPIPIATTLGTLAPGAELRVVGYGLTSIGDISPPRRRTGASVLDAIESLRLVSHGAPSQVCEGDSGGPALFDDGTGERVFGVASSGDDECKEFGKHARVDVHAGFIFDIVTRTAVGSADAGERCWYASNCAVGMCLPALDEPRLSFCSPECDNGTCPAGLECRASDGGEYCRNPEPSPGAEGSTCKNSFDCAGNLCLSPSDGDTTVCTTRCFSDLPGFDCPSGETCQLASDGGEACFAPDAGCGCRSSPGSSTTLVLIALALLGQGLRGRGRP